MGGYPQATGHRLYYFDTNFQEVVANQKPYPTKTGRIEAENCDFDKYLEGTPYRSERSHTLGKVLRNGDFMHNPMSGAPGFGDPLDRKAHSVVHDINEGVYTPDAAAQIYGVRCTFSDSENLWVLDESGTKERRQEIRGDRRNNSVSYEEFYGREKQLVVDGKLLEPVKDMLQGSMELSPEWAKEFRDFWGLNEDFSF